MASTFLFVSLFVFMLIGVPVAFSLGLASVLTFLFFTDITLIDSVEKLYATSEHFTLLAIPFFVLAAKFLSSGGVAKRMINFAVAAVGHIRGGLAMASVLACIMFAAISGSSPLP